MDSTLSRRPRSARNAIGYVRNTIRAALSFKRIAHDFNPSLLYSSTAASLSAGIASHALGIRSITHVHDLTLWSPRSVGLVYGMLLDASVDRIIAVSQAAKNAMPCSLQRKTEVVHNGVNLAHFRARPDVRQAQRACLNVPDSAFVVCCIGNIDPRKGQMTLVQAAARVAPVSADTHFLFIGSESPAGSEVGYAEALRQRVVIDSLGARVRFLGERFDVEQLLNAADVVVQCSEVEAGPLVPLEAMATGIPVIATGVGANAEEVVDGETGYIIPPKDPLALATAILRLERDIGTRKRMATNARAWVCERFSEETQFSKVHALCSRVLAGSDPTWTS